MTVIPEEISRRVTVFISYSHDSLEHRQRVWDLAKKLRSDGVNAVIDQYEPYPAEGFPTWMENQIDGADFVLLICTETYLRRVRGKETMDQGHGARWEGHLIYQHIYDDGTRNTKFIPILFSNGKPVYIPKPLRSFPYYLTDTAEGYEALFRRLSSQPRWLAPPLGRLRTLPPEIDALRTVESAEHRVSVLLKELLSSRTIPDLERCLAKSNVLLLDWPNNADVILLHHQVEQALEREKIAATQRSRPHAFISHVVASTSFLFYSFFGTAKRAAATGLTVAVGTGIGIGIRLSVENAKESRMAAQELSRDTPTVDFPTDGQVVNPKERAVVGGHLGGPSPSRRFVYLLHYGDRGDMIAHPAFVGPDGTWRVDLATWEHRRPEANYLEWQIVVLKSPFSTSLDPTQSFPPFLTLSKTEEEIVEQTKTISPAIDVRFRNQ